MNLRLRRLVERRPLFWSAVAALGAVLFADGLHVAGGLFVLATGILFLATGCWRRFMGVLALALLLGGLHLADVNRRAEARREMGEGRELTARVRLLEDAEQRGRGWLARVEDVGQGVGYRLRALGETIEKGAVLEVSGWLTPPAAVRNPGTFHREEWLDRLGVVGELKVASPQRMKKVSDAPKWRGRGDAVREGFRASVVNGLDPSSEQAAVIRAVVLGEHPDDDALIEPFRLTGTLHVFAVSGLHVGMVGLLGWGFLRLIGLPRRWAILPLVLLMFGYAWLTGMKPPAVRAAWMAAVVLGAFWFRRRPDAGNTLGLAALLMFLRDGDLVFTAGVQLSFGVVGAIWLLQRRVSHVWDWMAKEELYLPRALYGRIRTGSLWLRRKAAGLLTVSTSAWLGSAPLTAWHFGLVTPISVFASSLLALPVFVLLGLAICASVMAPFPEVGKRLNRMNGGVASSVLGIARVGEKVPGGHFVVPHDRPGDRFLTIYDVGAGGAACWFDGGDCALIDGGSKRSFEWVVLPSLRRMALQPETLVATHPDGHHAGGLIEALDAFPVEQVILPVERALGENYRRWLLAAEARSVPAQVGQAGQMYLLGDHAWLEVVHAPDSQNWHQLADDRVMMVRLHWRDWRILFTGDAGWTFGQRMLESGKDLRADLVVVGHHDRDAPTGTAFIKATGAKAVIANHDDFPESQCVPESWRKALENEGVSVFHQGECGAVVVMPEENQLFIRGWMNGQEVALDR